MIIDLNGLIGDSVTLPAYTIPGLNFELYRAATMNRVLGNSTSRFTYRPDTMVCPAATTDCRRLGERFLPLFR